MTAKKKAAPKKAATKTVATKKLEPRKPPAKATPPVKFEKMAKHRNAKSATKQPAEDPPAVAQDAKGKQKAKATKPKADEKPVVQHEPEVDKGEWGGEPLRVPVDEKPKKGRSKKKAATADEKQTELPGTEAPKPEPTPQQVAGAKAADAHFNRMADADRNGVVLKVTRKPHGGMIIDNIQIRDREMLRVAGEYAVAAGKSAEAACKKAELTQGEGEAATLKGYAEQALKTLEAAHGPTLELANGERHALMTGLRLYGGELQKIAEKEEQNLLPDDAAKEAISDVARLQRHLRHIDAPDMFVKEGKDTAPNKGKPQPEPEPAPAAAPAAPAEATGPYADNEVHDSNVVEAEYEILPAGTQRALPAGPAVVEDDDIVDHDVLNEAELRDAGVALDDDDTRDRDYSPDNELDSETGYTQNELAALDAAIDSDDDPEEKGWDDNEVFEDDDSE